MKNQMLQYSCQIDSLTQCQIQQIETLIKNLDSIKNENFVFFPNNLTIEKHQNQYEFIFTDDNKSLIGKESRKEIIQLMHQPIHYSKHLLLLLNRLSQLNIYLPTLTQESFIKLDESIEIDQQKQISVQRCVLCMFCLEKFDCNSQEIANNHCLSPELKSSIQDTQIDVNKIVFTEKMAIFNIGCIIFELFTLQPLYQDQKSNLTYYMFVRGFNYIHFLFGQLVQKCTLEEETEQNQRLTFKEALSSILYIEKCQEYIDRANLEQNSISIHDFFSQQASLHDKLVESLKIQVNHQITGRVYILQNLMRMKFIYILFSKEGLECFRDFLIIKLLIQELIELKELISYQTSKIQNQILNFKDSADEIKEFQKHYSSKYQQILLQLLKGIYENKYNDESKKHFEEQFGSNKVKDFQQNFHADLIIDNNTPRSQLHKLCLLNINSIFLKDQLILNFKPIFTQLINCNPNEIYDTLLSMLFENQDNKFLEIIKTIKDNQS